MAILLFLILLENKRFIRNNLEKKTIKFLWLEKAGEVRSRYLQRIFKWLKTLSKVSTHSYFKSIIKVQVLKTVLFVVVGHKQVFTQ